MAEQVMAPTEPEELLASILCDEFVLYTKTRNYHWNVTGEQFFALHKAFEVQYEALDEFVDELAERIRALDEFPPSTLAEFLDGTRLQEPPAGVQGSADEFVRDLVADHEKVLERLGQAVAQMNAPGVATNDLLTRLTVFHEKTAWMLRSQLLA